MSTLHLTLLGTFIIKIQCVPFHISDSEAFCFFPSRYSQAYVLQGLDRFSSQANMVHRSSGSYPGIYTRICWAYFLSRLIALLAQLHFEEHQKGSSSESPSPTPKPHHWRPRLLRYSPDNHAQYIHVSPRRRNRLFRLHSRHRECGSRSGS